MDDGRDFWPWFYQFSWVCGASHSRFLPSFMGLRGCFLLTFFFPLFSGLLSGFVCLWFSLGLEGPLAVSGGLRSSEPRGWLWYFWSVFSFSSMRRFVEIHSDLF